LHFELLLLKADAALSTLLLVFILVIRYIGRRHESGSFTWSTRGRLYFELLLLKADAALSTLLFIFVVI